MNIGELDKRIALYSGAATTDSWNHVNHTRVLKGTFWAKVIYKSGTEKQSADQRVGVDKVEFIIRHLDGMDKVSSVQYAADYYDIHSIEVIGRKEGLRLITTVRDNNQ
tara:strand:+ start:1051 stop:1374 length:324 start_codon:yes stop_codon:yes gene_type:complete